MNILTTIRKTVGYGFLLIAFIFGIIGAFFAIDAEDFQE